MNVFFVFSPLQLINAVEAKELLHTAENVLVIVRVNSLFWPMSIYEPLIKEDEWNAGFIVFRRDDNGERQNSLASCSGFICAGRCGER